MHHFKGWFRIADHARCDPLTVSDAFSRYLLCTQGLAQPDHARCRAQLERVFGEYGLPRVIRSDNGPRFAATGGTTSHHPGMTHKKSPNRSPCFSAGSGDPQRKRRIPLARRATGCPARFGALRPCAL